MTPAPSLAGLRMDPWRTFEATRYARGHKALYTLEINGEHGSLAWDLHDLHRLQWFDHKDEGSLRGWRSIHVTDGEHPYMANWWVPGLSIGYEHSFIHQVADFLNSLDGDNTCRTDFRGCNADGKSGGRSPALGGVREVGKSLLVQNLGGSLTRGLRASTRGRTTREACGDSGSNLCPPQE